jgi:DNA-binding CsgD family transcriptional regulator
MQGDYARGAELSGQGAAVLRPLDQPNHLVRALTVHGLSLAYLGDARQGRKSFAESLVVAQVAGFTWGIAMANLGLGECAYAEEDYAGAGSHFAEALTLFREARDARYVAHILADLGAVARETMDFEEAQRLLASSLTQFQELQDQRGQAVGLDALAALAAVQGNAERAAWLFGAGHALQQAVGTAPQPLFHTRYERALDAAKSALGAHAFDRAWADGMRAERHQAIARALGDPESSSQHAGHEAGLTTRELDVLRLLAEGLPNRDIAERLGISPPTVARHLANIYGKLDVSTRAAAAAYAFRHEIC